MKTVADKMRARRDALGLTQNEVALKAGLWPQDIYRFERGRNKPGLESIKKIAGALGVTAEWLAFGQEPPTKRDLI